MVHDGTNGVGTHGAMYTLHYVAGMRFQQASGITFYASTADVIGDAGSEHIQEMLGIRHASSRQEDLCTWT